MGNSLDDARQKTTNVSYADTSPFTKEKYVNHLLVRLISI